MKIIRATEENQDFFKNEQLQYGACSFYSEDLKSHYFFKINNREAIVQYNNTDFINDAIEEFLFFSGFIEVIKDQNGKILKENRKELYLKKISDLQPTQFYINKKKLDNSLKWIKNPADVMIPIIEKDGKTLVLDGHTRLKAALKLGFNSIYVYFDDSGDYIYKFAEEAQKRNIFNIKDLPIITDSEYKMLWHQFCADFFKQN